MHRIKVGLDRPVKWGRPTLLTAEEEDILLDVIFTNQKNHLSLTKKQFMILVREVSAKRREREVSDQYVDSFLRRYPAISLFTATKVSKARHIACTPKVFNEFFDIVEPELADVHPSRIFIMDETAILTPSSFKVSLILRRGRPLFYSSTY